MPDSTQFFTIMKRTLICFCAITALTFVACDDDSNDKTTSGQTPSSETTHQDPEPIETKGEACTTGDAPKCTQSGASVVECIDQVWKITNACEHGCKNGQCNPPPAPVVEAKCADAGLKACDMLDECIARDPDHKSNLLACCDSTYLYCFDKTETLCNPYYYKSNCGDDQNTATVCDGGVLKRHACGDSQVCLANDVYADCYGDADRCDELKSTKQVCRDDEIYETAMLTYTCTQHSNGQKYWVYEDYEYCDDGRGSCSEDRTTCLPREKCGEDYKPNCSADGTLAQYCFDGKVSKVYCVEGYHDGTCHATTTKAYCYTEAEECTTPGEKVTYCRDFYDMGMLFYEETFICEASDNGKNYLVNHPTQDPDCKAGCSADGRTCDEQGYAEE